MSSRICLVSLRAICIVRGSTDNKECVRICSNTVYVGTFARLNFREWRILKKFAFLFSRVELNNIRPQRVNKHFRKLNFRECLVIREIRESLTARKFQRIRYMVIRYFS